ncbi:39S ribosomal protein L10, mitochondrial [Amphibalanus amphitrite]|uniref:Large ribosomal subunit protein uL10m n=1 Tax=Amphibalanus amphitrite TaxID=1232801 RepID=A0A6A4VQX0_AMPAM|nr:39S ribosomal protein L10, mitochondrial [Amphibalanus amphitrite]
MVDGRYEVKLPWKEGAASDLMDNREAAEARLSGLVRKLDKEPDLRERYNAALRLVVRGPLLASVRHKARINIQKPKLPHWEKARFQRLTKPRLPDPVDARLAPHAGCFHAVEVPPAREAWQMLKRAGFTYHKLFNNRIAGHAFSETRLSPVLQLCRSHTALVTCPEPRVAQLLSLQKRLPQLVVIGGVVEDRFMSVADLERYAQLPSVDALRAQFCHLLSAQAAGLSASLGHHQAALVRSLAAYSEPAAAGRQGQEES